MSSRRPKPIRVAIIGSCQVEPLKKWTQMFAPHAYVESWPIFQASFGNPERIIPDLDGADIIISQVAPGQLSAGFELQNLQRLCGRAVYTPVFTFGGFHPDAVICPLNDGSYVGGPFGTLHSAVVAAGYRLGLPATQTCNLFNAMVFEAAGFLEVFEPAHRELIRYYGAAGYDISDAFEGWNRRGLFMHTPSHPDIDVMKTITRMTLEKVGLSVEEPKESPEDWLLTDVIWPVHEPLAKRLGVAARPIFRRPITEVSSEPDRDVDMLSLVKYWYRLYAQHDLRDFGPFPRTDATIAALSHLLGRS